MTSLVYKYLFKSTIPVIHVNGPIMYQSVFQVEKSLELINFQTAKALAVVVNSPGGLITQGDLICKKIKAFSHQHHIPLYTFAEDVAASGGYQILCIGDKVYVDQSSLVGSIGVISYWVGLKKLLQKNKIESRSFVSNEKNSLKKILSKFDDINEEGLEKFNLTMKECHELFIEHVHKYRGALITVPESERNSIIYNADVFDGDKAVQIGLADGIGNYQEVLQNLHPDCQIVHVSFKSIAQRIKEQLMTSYGVN